MNDFDEALTRRENGTQSFSDKLDDIVCGRYTDPDAVSSVDAAYIERLNSKVDGTYTPSLFERAIDFLSSEYSLPDPRSEYHDAFANQTELSFWAKVHVAFRTTLDAVVFFPGLISSTVVSVQTNLLERYYLSKLDRNLKNKEEV